MWVSKHRLATVGPILNGSLQGDVVRHFMRLMAAAFFTGKRKAVRHLLFVTVDCQRSMMLSNVSESSFRRCELGVWARTFRLISCDTPLRQTPQQNACAEANWAEYKQSNQPLRVAFGHY